jgi:TonB-dependent starch-binding outer membrane protein SusC
MKKNLAYALMTLFLLCSGTSFAQQTVSGIVYDAENKVTLPGVNVIQKGTTNGTVSDINGKYSLTVTNKEATLVFSFIGFASQEIEINGQSTIDVKLAPDIFGIDEIVVTGYGTQKKSDLTGSVAVVDVSEMQKESQSNMGTMLQGRIAGVNVTSNGEPGASPTIRIRGISTFGDAAPLYIIDGVPVGTSVRDFSPNNIESVQVLKDASAAAIYGSRAANGVIIITTKRGKKDTPLQIDYKGYVGIDNIWQKIPVLGRVDYQNTYNNSLVANNMSIRPGNDPTSDSYINDINTDWQEEGLKTGIRHNHNVSLSGGSKSSSYNVMLDYLNTKGTLEGYGPDYTRYTVKANNNFEKGIFKAATSINYSHSHQNSLNSTDRTQFSGGNPPMVVKLLSLIPTMKAYDETTSTGYGTYDTYVTGEDYSLNIIAINNIMEQYTDVDRMFANGNVEMDFAKLFKLKNQTLKYKINLSYDKTHCHDFDWIPAFSLSSFYTNTNAALSEAWREYTTGLVENTINYGIKAGQLKADVLLGQMYQKGTYKIVSGYGEGFSEPYYKELPNATSTSSTTNESEHYISSYLGRINLDYGDRYLLTVTARRDGSSRFSKDNRFGIFPSAAFGWKFHNEKLYPFNKNIVSEFKLRASYGELGNENIGEYLYLATVTRTSVYNFNNEVVIGGTNASIVDPNLKWETKKMTNIGLDLSLFKRAIEFSAEYYKSESSDLLVDVDIPLSVGSIDDSPTVNSGSMENSGFEGIITYHGGKGKFKYNISANIATAKNKVTQLGQNGQPIYGSASRTIEGKEVGRFYGYVYDGIFQTEDEVSSSAFQTASTAPGDIKFKDISGEDGKPDNVIDSYDRTDLGSALPDYTYGISFSANYGNLDFSLFANGAAGFKIANNLYRTLMHSGGGLNWHEDILDAWTSSNTDTNIPRVVYEDPNDNDRNSNRPGWLQKGDFLRISNFTVGYSLPESAVNNYISSARVYFTCQNLYTFTKYKGYNPDFNNSNVWSPGYNSGGYPVPRTFIFGVNLSF